MPKVVRPAKSDPAEQFWLTIIGPGPLLAGLTGPDGGPNLAEGYHFWRPKLVRRTSFSPDQFWHDRITIYIEMVHPFNYRST